MSLLPADIQKLKNDDKVLLQNKDLTAEDLKTIVFSLKQNDKIQTLKLQGNEITDIPDDFFEAVRKHPTLVFVDLTDNKKDIFKSRRGQRADYSNCRHSYDSPKIYYVSELEKVGEKRLDDDKRLKLSRLLEEKRKFLVDCKTLETEILTFNRLLNGKKVECLEQIKQIRSIKCKIDSAQKQFTSPPYLAQVLVDTNRCLRVFTRDAYVISEQIDNWLMVLVDYCVNCKATEQSYKSSIVFKQLPTANTGLPETLRNLFDTFKVLKFYGVGFEDDAVTTCFIQAAEQVSGSLVLQKIEFDNSQIAMDKLQKFVNELSQKTNRLALGLTNSTDMSQPVQNDAIIALDFSGNGIVFYYLKEFLDKNRNLETLTLQNYRVCQKNALSGGYENCSTLLDFLSIYLKNNKKLKSIDLRNNEFSSEEINKFANVLLEHNTIVEVLFDNPTEKMKKVNERNRQHDQLSKDFESIENLHQRVSAFCTVDNSDVIQQGSLAKELLAANKRIDQLVEHGYPTPSQASEVISKQFKLQTSFMNKLFDIVTQLTTYEDVCRCCDAMILLGNVTNQSEKIYQCYVEQLIVVAKTNISHNKCVKCCSYSLLICAKKTLECHRAVCLGILFDRVKSNDVQLLPILIEALAIVGQLETPEVKKKYALFFANKLLYIILQNNFVITSDVSLGYLSSVFLLLDSDKKTMDFSSLINIAKIVTVFREREVRSMHLLVPYYHKLIQKLSNRAKEISNQDIALIWSEGAIECALIAGADELLEACYSVYLEILLGKASAMSDQDVDDALSKWCDPLNVANNQKHLACLMMVLAKWHRQAFTRDSSYLFERLYQLLETVKSHGDVREILQSCVDGMVKKYEEQLFQADDASDIDQNYQLLQQFILKAIEENSLSEISREKFYDVTIRYIEHIADFAQKEFAEISYLLEILYHIPNYRHYHQRAGAKVLQVFKDRADAVIVENTTNSENAAMRGRGFWAKPLSVNSNVVVLLRQQVTAAQNLVALLEVVTRFVNANRRVYFKPREMLCNALQEGVLAEMQQLIKRQYNVFEDGVPQSGNLISPLGFNSEQIEGRQQRVVSVPDRRHSKQQTKREITPIEEKLGELKQLGVDIDSLEIPEEYLCPISQTIMLDPVSTADGHFYDRGQIAAWFAQEKKTSPKTNEKLHDLSLRLGPEKKGQILEFLEGKIKEVKNDNSFGCSKRLSQ